MKVLVTGANGHVGLALVQLLVERGHQVRASMRGAQDAEKSGALRTLGVEVVEADVLDADAMERAAAGTEALFHVAAVFRYVAKDPEREVVAPSVIGAENAVRAAKKAGVRRVVLTSSCVAVGTTNPGRPLDERDFNDGGKNPYFRAKTGAERRAAALAAELGVDLVSVNPSSVFGPGFHRHTPSTLVLANILDGKMPFAPPMRFPFVDTRDVALGHLLALENPKAQGRYILHTETLTVLELARALLPYAPSAKIPTRELPLWALPLVVPLDWLAHKTQGAPRQVTRESVREMPEPGYDYNSARARAELGWTTRPVEQTLEDTVRWIRERRPPAW